jgi:Zn-finger nucleic acid-binding protein
MECPNCKVTLLMTVRDGVEIDYCPQCRGIWLDKGELDKLLEKGRQFQQPTQQTLEYNREESQPQAHKPHQPKRRESFLEDIFDIF